MKPIIRLIDEFTESVSGSHFASINKTFNHLEEFMQTSRANVESLLKKRKRQGKITSIDQTLKSLAGNIFSNLVELLFLRAKQNGDLPQDIFIDKKTSAFKKLASELTIHIGGETQKPDCDLIFYNERNSKIVILSLKTSLRERAGQSYRWKLLLDVACDKGNKVAKKYGISYQGKNPPVFCFATTNFYNEINKPQQRGVMKFFDGAFIAKNKVESSVVRKMSTFLPFIVDNLK